MPTKLLNIITKSAILTMNRLLARRHEKLHCFIPRRVVVNCADVFHSFTVFCAPRSVHVSAFLRAVVHSSRRRVRSVRLFCVMLVRVEVESMRSRIWDMWNSRLAGVLGHGCSAFLDAVGCYF